MNHDFKQLQYWQKARTLVKDIYLVIGAFPREERFFLTDQIRRSSISIPSNVAEGCGRQLAYFLDIVQGSTMELETQLILANDLHYLPNESLGALEQKLHELRKMNVGLRNRLITKF